MRLFFLQSHNIPVQGGGAVNYRGGQFYMIDDLHEAEELVAAGVAETEEQHAKRLADEAEAAAKVAEA